MCTTINKNELVDIRDVQVDSSLSRNERIKEYNKQIKDPCHYKCGKLTVTARFPNNGVSIEDCLKSMVSCP
jgi:hypothetical protein